MDSYKFTYKDVLKRYERIINKPSKFEIRLLAIVLLIITIVNITSLCFAYEEEEVELSQVNGIIISLDSNYFISSAGGNVKYFLADPNYIYHITLNQTDGRVSATSSEVPALNGPYQILKTFGGYETFSYRPTTETYVGLGTSSNWVVTREKVEGQTSAVEDLVDNVGISQIWDIFDTGIGFVGVVVLVAFGIFLIVIAIKKVSKGKSDF